MKNTPNRTFWQRIFGIHPEVKQPGLGSDKVTVHAHTGDLDLPKNFWDVLANPANDGKQIILKKSGNKITIIQTTK